MEKWREKIEKWSAEGKNDESDNNNLIAIDGSTCSETLMEEFEEAELLREEALSKIAALNARLESKTEKRRIEEELISMDDYVERREEERKVDMLRNEREEYWRTFS